MEKFRAKEPTTQSRTNAKKLYLTEKQVARRLNMSVKWLQKMRAVGGGIKYSKFGFAVRYPIEEIEAYEKQALRYHSSDEATD